MEIEATDVVRVVLQFLKEHSLTRSLQALQEESQVALNTVDSTEAFVADVQNGRWEAVMPAIATMQLPAPLLADLYEHITLELIELRELETARQILRAAPPMVQLKERQSERHARLEVLAGKPYFDARDAYPSGASKERRRGQLAEALRTHVTTVPPSRLLALLGQALKWQQHQGQLPVGARFDLLAGGEAKRALEPEARVSAPGPVIKFGKKSHAECALFSPDGQYLVSGSVDGFLEVRRPCPPERDAAVGWRVYVDALIRMRARERFASPNRPRLRSLGTGHTPAARTRTRARRFGISSAAACARTWRIRSRTSS